MSKAPSKVETALAKLTPVEPGQLIEIERFEEIFGYKRDTQEFNWLISGIRRALHESGLHLSGEGRDQVGGYTIVHPTENFYIAKLAMAQAARNLRDKQTLLLNTKLDGFSVVEKARHENTLRTISLRITAMERSREVEQLLARKKKKVIEEDLLEE